MSAVSSLPTQNVPAGRSARCNCRRFGPHPSAGGRRWHSRRGRQLPSGWNLAPTSLSLIQLFFRFESQRSNCGTSLMQLTRTSISPSLSKSPNRAAAPRHRFENAGSTLGRHIGERPFAKIAIQDFALPVSRIQWPISPTSGYTCPLQSRMSAQPSLSKSRNIAPQPRKRVFRPSPA